MRILGFDAIDVGAFAGFVHLEPSEIASDPESAALKLKEIGDRHEITFTDLFVTFGKDLTEDSVNWPEKSVRDANAGTFRKLALFCRLCGIPGITLCPGVEHPALGREASLAIATDELARLAELGQRDGLRVSFEAHLESIAESPAEALRIVKAAPHLSLTLDYSHFIAQGYTVSDVEPLLDHAAHVHIRQAKPGTLQARDDDGTIDFEMILAELERRGYRGAVAFEYEWNSWQGNNRVDVLSETLALRRRLRRFTAATNDTDR